MIAFACPCKNRLEVPEDQAGDVIQCPKCGRLNDIPTLDDLPHLDADGVFDIYAERPVDDPSRLAELGILYATDGRDADGDEIDLRYNPNLPRNVVDDDGTIPLAGEDEEAKPRPKYDPETGELIRPLEIKEDPDLPVSGVAIPLAQTVISYATPAADFRRVSGWKILIELFAPPNVMVMGFVLLFAMLFLVTGIIVNYGMVFVVVAPVFFLGALLAHFGITVEEIGPEEQDELPRLLRNLGWHDDLWEPFQRVAVSLFLAFLPLWISFDLPPGPRFVAAFVGVAFGFFILPAMLLTSLTSGTWLNLRPDRLLGVIRATGRNYVIAVVAGVLSVTSFVLGLGGTFVAMWTGFATPGTANSNLLTKGYFAFPMLLFSIYIAHAWAWYMGLMYRAHHGQFPWILQRHISTRRTHLDPATDYTGKARRPKRTTEEKLRAARAQNAKRFENKGNA